MKRLKNWDNKNWLSSKKYIDHFHNFLKSKAKINKSTKILDIGCGRANIISYLNNKYKFINKPIGVDIFKNDQIKKNIVFKKKDAIKYLKNSKDSFDLILIKQTIHFFKKKEVDRLLNLAKKNLTRKGKIVIFSLKTSQNEFPTFKNMKKKLNIGLKRDKSLIEIIKKNFIKYKKSNFKFKVSVSKRNYIKKIKKRYISCLLNISKKEIQKGIIEIQSKYKKNIQFNDILDCFVYQN